MKIALIPTNHAAQEARKKKIQPYWTSLGRFVEHYAQLEDAINGTLFHVAAVDPKIGKVIFSGVRIKAAIDFMNKIFDVADQTERKQRLKRYFDQIGLITSMRDKLIHSGVQFDENTHEFVWNNIKAAHIEEKYTQFNVSADMLDDLTTDISQIIFGLSYEFGKDSMPDEAAEWLRQKMRPTWRYKPPQRVVRRRKKTDTPQELQSQPGKHDLELRAADYPAQVESDT